MAARDPYEYFRVEARELLEHLNRGALALEREPSPAAAAAVMLRHAHTLKGAARVVRLNPMADKVHALEGMLAPLREGGAPSHPLVDSLLELLDQIGAHLSELDRPATAAVPATAPARGAPAERRLDTVRLEVAELDSVMEGLREAAGCLGVLRRESEGLARARSLAQGLGAHSGAEPRLRAAAQELEGWLERFQRRALPGLEQAERELADAHDRAGRLRMLPASALFTFLERVCRDAAAATGKAVRFEAVGGDQRLDSPVLAALHEALQHAVRNAVAHGIEEPQRRRALGKPAEGRVLVTLERLAGQVRVSCSDDGQGIDPAAVRRAAAARGLLPAGAPPDLDLDQAVALLLGGGLSTSPRVTDLAGRGLGLDVLRSTVDGLKGRLSLRSRPGQGTEVEILVPPTLASYRVLAVVAAGRTSLIPFEAVRAALQEGGGASPDPGDTLLHEGQALPWMALDACLGDAPGPAGRRRPGVVLRSAAGSAVLVVDRILGVREAVVLPLPELAPDRGLAAGASLDAAGDPCLVLDPDGLVRAAARGGRGAAAPPALERLPLLVIDDSLTTRRLEQSILETAGYAVDTASSAEEGLLKARARRYGLILVDVEMPGMDGFSFVERLGADPALRDIPAILVSSRNSAEDLRRGREAGARDYMTKGEFDQARLLGRIRELLA